ncbi:hypothetical protein [Pseudomonas fluorescens]|uniref:hypothetical protein n=1 Tax=Pseudomonas fluorescens TaxID=294 RepID=UPI00123F6C63|nr:hypothetical protein [Pseudomonas fluorescens]VVO48013.1 hypothetical protein PS898_00132 [Pseudomonas fluorescens]
MLKTLLEQQDKHLYLNIPQTHAGKVKFKISPVSSVPELLGLDSGNVHSAYYLPWAEDKGLFIDLPAIPTGTDPRIFLTDNLTGCCVGIQSFGGFIRIRHYNLATTMTQRPVFSNDDLFRFGTNTSWLLPGDKYDVNTVPGSASYVHVGAGGGDAILWGEYVSRYWPFTSKWHFYYQNGNLDTVIHELNYQ